MTAAGCLGGLITTARVGLGVIVLALGVLVGYDQSRRADVYRDSVATLTQLAEDGIPTLPANELTTAYDGRMAYLRGPLVVPPVTDSLTGLVVETWRLERTVELVGDNERVNADAKPYPDEVFISDDFRLGPWRLSVYAYAWPEREEASSELLEAARLREGWVVREGYVYAADDPDVRIRYTYHPVPADTFSVLGVPDAGMLDLSDDLAELPLAVPGSVSSEQMIAGLVETERGVQSIWMMYAWVGLLLLLRPVTRPFRIFKGLTEAPLPSRILKTGAVAAVIVLALAWLMP